MPAQPMYAHPLTADTPGLDGLIVDVRAQIMDADGQRPLNGTTLAAGTMSIIPSGAVGGITGAAAITSAVRQLRRAGMAVAVIHPTEDRKTDTLVHGHLVDPPADGDPDAAVLLATTSGTVAVATTGTMVAGYADGMVTDPTGGQQAAQR